MAAILLALAASASWGVSDFLGGLASRRLSLPTVMAITTPLGLVVIGAIVAIRGEPMPSTSFVLWAALAGVLGAIGITSLYQGLAIGRMGVVAPISATAPLIPIVVGLARGERPSSVQAVGIALALVGMVLTSRERDSGSGRSRIATGAVFGLLAAGAFGFSLVALAGVLGAIGITSLYQGLAIGRMGVVAPISATAPLIPIVVGLARGERPSSVQAVGIGLALVGMVLTSRERDSGSGRSRIATGAVFGLLAAGAFGFSLVALDEGANADPYWATLILRTASSILILSVVIAMRRPVRAPRSYWPALGVIGALDVLGTVFFSVSTTKGLISIVAAVISFVPVFVALLARVVLHERLQRIQLVGAGIAITGVVFISAG